MAESFDPYLQWLGIRDPQRPPNHYRLLGVDPFESDPDVLIHAADRQMAHVRTFQTGRHSAESQNLLNELAAAKVCLLNPQKKAEYDTRLRAEQQQPASGGLCMSPPPLGAAGPPAAQPPGDAAAIGAVAEEPPPLPTPPDGPAPTGPVPITLEPPPNHVPVKKSSPILSCAITVLGAMAIALIGLIVLFTIGGQGKKGPGPTEKTAGPETGPEAEPRTPAPETPQPHTPEPLTPRPETPKPHVPQPDHPEPDTPQPETPQPDTPEPETPEPDTPEPDTPQPPEDHRLAIPAPAAQEEMLKEIRELFEQEYANAKQRAQLRDLAAMLMQKAMETKDDPVARYVLFTEACEAAIAAGDSQLFLRTVRSLGEQYTIEWLVMAAATLHKAARRSRDAQADKALARTALDLTGTAIQQGDYDMAAVLAEAARDLARNPRRIQDRDPTLVRRAVTMMNDVAALQRQRRDFLEAEKVLAERPDDPQANLTAGRYLCLIEGDFARALPMLRKGSDALLVALAEAEITQPAEIAEMVTLGHRWWEASEEVEEADRRSLQSRAVYWYQRALPGSTGLTRTKVQRRIEEFRGNGSGGRN